MLPAFSSRHLGVGTSPSLSPSLPPSAGLTFALGEGRGLKNPGSFNSICGTPTLLRARARLPRAEGPRHELPSGGPGGKATRRGRPNPRRPPRPCSLATSAQRRSSRGGQAAAPPTARGPASPAPRAPRHSPARAPAGEESAPGLEGPRGPRSTPTRPRPAPRPAKRQVQLCWLVAPGGGRAGRGAPDGIASGPRALTCTAQSMGVARRTGREVSVTPPAGREGVRPGACPRPHLSPSQESPRAGPRARQCARAALPSTAGGGGGESRAGARGDARRRPRGRSASAP